MTGKVELTAVQRSAAIDRTADSLALVSGAGCGKTLVLAQRYVQLLMGSGDQDDPLLRFVAITFTEKAALEMQQRVRRLLGEIASGSTGRRRLRLLDWRQRLPEARISTIHSFCASLLRARAVETGVDPAFRVCADDLAVQCMISEASEAALLEAVEAGREDAAALLADDSFDTVVRQVCELVNSRTTCDLKAYFDPQATVDRWKSVMADQAAQAWAALESDAALADALAKLADRPCANDSDRLLPVRDELVEVAQSLLKAPAAGAAETFARMAEIHPGAFGSDRAWGGKGSAKAVRDLIKQIKGTLSVYALYTEQPGPLDTQAAEALAALARLADRAVRIYTERKRRSGLLDFDDLLIYTGRLFAHDKAVCKSLGRQIDQFLIDECQDTDSLQMRLIERLLCGGEATSRPPAGRLFLVGDAKQSIYRFRGAQVEVFNDLCRRLGPNNNESLDVSFRAHKAGIAFINHLFASLMGGDYSPIRAHRKELPPGPSVEILLASSSGGREIQRAGEAAAAQAQLTAQRIRRMLDGGEKLVWEAAGNEWRAVRPGDIAVLFARMTHSLEYERQLGAHDIPYYVVAGTGFFKQQEVFDVLNALRAIDNPFDDVAFFGVLRSRMFGLDDNSLMHIARACRAPYLPAAADADLADKLDAPQLASLTKAVQTIQKLHRRKDAVGIDALIDSLLDVTGYEATLLCLGRRPAGNLRLLIERARTAAAEGMALADFIRQSDELILNESRYEQAAVAGEGEDVVRLMTIHKAKGLEFPVVFVPDLNAGRHAGRGTPLNRTDLGLTYKFRSHQEDEKPPDQPLASRLAERLEQADQQKEDIRKLYVAATRHKDHLVFVGADWRNKEGRTMKGGSYLGEMDRVLGITRALDDGRDTIDYDGMYAAVVRRIAPGETGRRSKRVSLGGKALAEASGPGDLAERIRKLAGPAPAPALLGPLPADQGRVEIAVTALCDFDFCPMLYRWRYELGVPDRPITAKAHGPRSTGPGASAEASPAAIDPATMGTLLHRCMELLDFAHPQPARELVRRAAAEMNLGQTMDTDAVGRDLSDMIERFSATALWSEVAGAAERLCELDFVLECGPAVLRGQIDLIYQDAGGAWHIVDYKSDRIEAAQAAGYAGRYRLQMLAYAAAAARYLESPPAEARLYFLRPAAAVTMATAPDAVESARLRIADVARGLLSARRTGRFARTESATCESCLYAALCTSRATKDKTAFATDKPAR